MEHDIRIERERCVGCGQCARSCGTGFLRMGADGPETGGRIRCIGCGHCVAACPRQAVRLDGKGPVSAPESAWERTAMLRRSVRKYKQECPPLALIERALNLAAWAPSGKNRHVNRWSVVYGRDRCRAVEETALAYCRRTGDSPELLALEERGIHLLTGGAPVVIIGWSPDNALNPCVDTVLALYTAELLLEEQGLGCCWGGYLRQITGRCPELKELLGIPEGCSLQCCMMTGYPDRESYPNIPPRPKAEVYMV